MKYQSMMFALFILGCRSSLGGLGLTAEEYARILETRFEAGESPESIAKSFETNRLFDTYELLPFCYDFSVDTTNLEHTINRYQEKLQFIDSLLTPYSTLIHLPSNIWKSSVGQLLEKETIIQHEILRRYEESPTTENLIYWKSLYPQAMIGHYSGPVNRSLCISPAAFPLRHSKGFVDSINQLSCTHRYERVLHFDNCDVPRSELYAELSTNTKFKADSIFQYCLTERADFPTNDIEVAEKEVWRNNFVLEIVTRSCNFHTNEANRALDTAYTNRLSALRRHYEELPAEATEIFGTNRVEWLQKLGGTIDEYILETRPFR